MHRFLFSLLLLCLLMPGCRNVEQLNRELMDGISNVNEYKIYQALEHGANPNTAARENETALGLLMRQYKYSHNVRRIRIERTATAMLEYGADPNALHHGFTPLQIAVGQRSETLVSRLLIKGADPNLETKAGLAPIWQAVYDNNYKIGQRLLQGGANPNARDEKGRTPLEYLKARGYTRTRLMVQLKYYGGR